MVFFTSRTTNIKLNMFSSGPDSWHFGTDPDPAFSVSALQDAKIIYLKFFFCLLLFEGKLTSFIKDKKSQRSKKNSRSKGLSYYFCLIKMFHIFYHYEPGVLIKNRFKNLFNSVPDPDSPDPIVRSMDPDTYILFLSSSKNSFKNFDCYCFATSYGLFIFEK